MDFQELNKVLSEVQSRFGGEVIKFSMNSSVLFDHEFELDNGYRFTFGRGNFKLQVSDHIGFSRIVFSDTMGQFLLDLEAHCPENMEQKYLKNSCVCPSCGSENISGGSWDADSDYAGRKIWCDDCGDGWVDTYRLVGMEMIHIA